MDIWPVSGADLLVHGSNLILLFAYTRRDMISLRILALVAALTIIPYYVIQPQVLWPPIFWSVIYAGVHGYHIVALLRERRPVAMTPDEERLLAMSFPSLNPHEFKRLMDLCEWFEEPAGTEFSPGAESVLLLFRGRVIVSSRGSELGRLEPGQLLGIAMDTNACTYTDTEDFDEPFVDPARAEQLNHSLLHALVDGKDLIGEVG